jgi:hypothetical protein
MYQVGINKRIILRCTANQISREAIDCNIWGTSFGGGYGHVAVCLCGDNVQPFVDNPKPRVFVIPNQ